MDNQQQNTGMQADDAGGVHVPAVAPVASESGGNDIGALSLDPQSLSEPAAPEAPAQPQRKRNWLYTPAVVAGLVLLTGFGGMLFMTRSNNNASQRSTPISSGYATQRIPLVPLAVDEVGLGLADANVIINGSLRLNDAIIIAPSVQPNDPTAGQLYFDQNTNQLAYYNGGAFVPLTADTPVVQSLGGVTGELTLGGGLTVIGNQLTATSQGVISLDGQAGAFTLGSGLTLSGNTLQNDGVLNILPGTSISVTDDGNGTFTINNIGAGTGTVTSGGGTAGTVPIFTGSQNIEDSLITQALTTITVTGDLDVVGGDLTLANALTVANGGTGATSLTADGVIVGNGTGALTSVTAGAPGLCLQSTAGAPAFAVCPGGGGGVTSLDGLTGALTVNNATGVGTVITIDDASTIAKGIASFNATNFTVVAGAVNTIQNINSGATPTFAGVNTNSITPSAALTVGISAQTALLQGSTTTITSNGAGNDIVLNSADTIELQDNTNVTGALGVSGNATFAGDVAVNGGDLTSSGALNITPGGALTVGATAQNLTLQGDASTSLRATSAGNTTIVSFTSPTANTTLNFPALSAGTYTVCTTAGNCAGAGVTLQSAYNNSSTPEIVLDATRAALTIRDNATPIGGNLLEVQNNAGGTTYLAVTATGLTVTGTATVSGTINSSGGNLQTGGTTRIDNAGNASNIGSLTLSGAISGGTSFTGSSTINTTGGVIQTNSTTRVDNSGNLVNIAAITASGNASIQGGSVTIGTSSQAGNVVLNDGSSNTGTLQLAALAQNTIYTLPDPGTGSVNICLSSGNCAGTGGGVTTLGGTPNTVPKFTGTQTIGDSIITDNGTTVTIGGTLAVNTITPTAAFTVGATGQTTTLQGSITSITSTGAGNDIILNSADTIELQDNTNISGNLDVSGTLTSGTGNAFQVDASGNVTAGTINGQTISAAASFTGTVTVATGFTLTAGNLAVNSGNVTASGNATLQGGAVTLGTTSQGGSLVLHDGNGQTATIFVADLAGNRALTIPAATGADTFCLQSLANCSGAATTLQSAYNNSTSPEIVLDATRAALTLRDNATPIGGNLFEVQNNAGGTTYFGVTASGVDVAGTVTASGNINTSGGALQTGGATRIDNAGNASNIGNISLSGSISGGTNITGSGTINTTGGAIQTNSTNRVDNAGNLVNIGNISGAGAITVASSGAGNDVTIDGADQFIVQDAAVFNALTTLTSDVDITLADAENLAITSTVTGTTSVNLIGTILTNNTSSGAQNVALLQNAASSGSTEGLLVLDNADTDTVVTSGMLVTSAAGGITNALDVSDPDIVTALLFGANDLVGTNLTVTGASGNLTSAGNAILQGGAVTVGTTSQAGTVVLHDGSSNTGTLEVAVLGSNQTYTFPDATGEVCLSTGNCAGAGVTLQIAYDNSTSPEIVVDATRGALTLRDNATPIGANLFEVQNNAGGTTYFGVTSSGVSIAGTATVSGNINSSGGALQTGGTTRVDNSGNLTNIGSLTLSGAISGGTTYSGSGNINTSGGALQTAGTARLDSSGNLVNIGNLTATGAITIASSGAGNDVVIDGADQFIIQDAAVVNGSAAFNGLSTFTTDVDLALGETENLSITNIVTGSNSVNVIGAVLTNNSTSGTQQVAVLQNASGSGATEGLLVLDNADADTAVTSGLQITSAAGGITNAVDVSDPDIATALLFGANDITGTNFSVTGATGSFTSVGNATVQGGTVTVGTASQAGALIVHDGSSNTGTLQTIALGQDTVYNLPDPGTGTVTICVSTGNCAGSGSGVTTGGGTNNRLAKFTAAQNIENSTISDDGTNVTTTVDLVVQGGEVTVGTSSQLASLLLHDGNGQTTTLNAGDSAGNLTFILPTTAGSANQCLKQSGTGNQLVWDACDGGGGGTSATLQSAYDDGNTITTTNARDIAFTLANTGTDSNFTVTIADDSTSTVSFVRVDGTGTADPAQLLLLDNQDANRAVAAGIKLQAAGGGLTAAIDASDAEIVDALNAGANNIVGTTGDLNFSNFDVIGSSGNVTAGTYNGQTISSAASFTGTVTIATDLTLTAGDIAVNGGNITASGALSIDPGGAFTAGATGQTTTLRGSTTTISSNGAGNDITLNSADTIELQDNTNVTGNFAITGTVNTNTFSGSALTFGSAATATIQSAASQALTLTANAASTWSTSAGDLTVQAATGLNLRAVSGNINLGTSDTTGTLLVLDIKTDSGDPTGTDGAIYYNSDMGSFRCFQGAWTNCITASGGFVSLQNAYDNGNTIATDASGDIAFTLNNQNFTVSTAAGASGFTTYSLADGSNATPPAQLVLITNADTNQALASGLKIASSAGGITNAIDVSGSNITNAIAIGANAISGTNFSVTGGGAVTAVGVNAGTGLVQGTGGLTISGATISLNNNSNFATNINTGTSSGTVTLGGGSAPLVIDSTNFDVTSGGALSGITGLTMASGNFTQNGAGSLSTGSGSVSLNGATTVAANQNLTLQNGNGVFSQTYASASASSAQVLSATNSNSGGSSVAVNGQDITLVGTATSGGINSNSAIRFANPLAAANNVFYGLNFAGTGYTDILHVSGTQIISGAGILQNSGISSGVNYSNLTQVGTLTSGALGAGFTTVSVAQGGTGAISFTSNGVLYGNGSGAVQATAAGTTGQCFVGNTGGAPSWANCDTQVSLQDAYDNGNTIATDASGDIAFTLNGEDFTVTAAAGSDSFTTFALADGSNAAPAAQLVLIHNNDTNQAVAAGLTVTSASGGITTAFDASGSNITSALSIGSNAIAGTNFSVTGGGAVTAVGVNAGTGLLQSTGGLTVTGTASINTNSNNTTSINTGTSSGTITLGGGSAPLVIDSTNFDVTSGGAVSGVTTLATSGIITVGSLGANTGATSICRNGSNQISSCSGAGGIDAAATLQNAYANGNSITTTSARDLSITLADTATDSNFTVTVADDSTSTVSIVRADGAGTNNPTQLLIVENLDANQAIANGIVIQSAAGTIVDGLDVSDSELTNAVNVGDNVVLGTTAVIDFTNFDVSSGGNITLGGSVSGGTSVTGSGNFNSTSGSLQTANTTRVDNSGNLVNIGNLTATGAITIASSGPGNDVTIDGADQLIVQDAAVFNGVTAFTTDVDMTFAGSENLSIASDLSGSVDVATIIGTPSASAGTARGLAIQQATSANTNGLDAALYIDNADADLAIAAAISIQNSGGGNYTAVMDILGTTLSAAEITVLDGGITLGSETNGDYVASFTAGTGLTGDASGEGSTPTLSVNTSAGVTASGDNVVLDVNYNPTWTADHTWTLSGTENLDVTHDLGGTINMIGLVGTPSASAGTTRGIFIQQAASANTNGLDQALVIDNADTDLAIPVAIQILNSGGGNYTNIMDILGTSLSASELTVLDGGITESEVTGEIEAVTAGNGLTGGGTADSVTLDIASANGAIVVNANDIALTVASSADGLSATTSSGSGLEVLASGLSLLQGCGDTNVLKWNETTDVWACGSDSTANSFATIDTPAGTDPTADAASDTLQLLVTGANFTVTGTNDPETITFNLVESVLAGDGLAVNGDALDITIGNGLELNSDAVRVNQDFAFTWTNDHTYTFAGTENVDIASDLGGSVNVLNIVGTPSASAGTTRGIFLQQANSANTNGLDAGLYIDNADTNLAIPAAISIQNSGGGGYTTVVDNAGTLISGAELNLLDGRDTALVDVNDAVSTAITGVGTLTSGALGAGFTAVAVAQGGTGATTLTSNGVLYGNGTGAIQATAAGTTGQCLVGNTGSAPSWSACSAFVTLQNAYNNSTSPEITLDATRGALTIRDASSALGANLFEVQNNAGNTDYFAVTDVGIAVSGGADVSGNVDAGGISTSGTERIDSSGNLTAIGNLTATGAITIASTGGGNDITLDGADQLIVQDAAVFNALSTFNTDVDMVLAGTENITITSDLAGTVSVASIVGTPSASAGTTRGLFIQQANSANTNGLDAGLYIDNADTNLAVPAAISIQNSGGGDYTAILDVLGTSLSAAEITVLDGGIDLGSETNGSYVASFTAGTGLTGDAAGEGSTPTLSVNTSAGVTTSGDNVVLDTNYNPTWTADHTWTLAGTENLDVTHDLGGTVNMVGLVGTPSASAGTTRGIFIQQAASANTNGLDGALVIDNADTDLAIPVAIQILNSGGGNYTNIMDILGTSLSASELTVLDGGITESEVTGEIEAVTAGSGLTGGGTADSVTLDVASGNGAIVVNVNDITLTVAPSANGLSATTSSGSGLEVLASGLSLLQGCSDTQILKWNETSDIWACAADNGGSASNSFETIDVPSGTDPVADSSTDTLTFTVTGTNLTVTGTAGTDTIDLDISESTLAGAGLVANGSALDVASGNAGIVVGANALTLTLTTSADGQSATTSAGSGLEIVSGGLTLLQGCSDGQILKWDEASDIWACSADQQGAGSSPFGSTGGVITKNTASDRLSLIYGDAGDVQLDITNIAAGTAPTADAMQILLSGGSGVSTDNVDGLYINIEGANGTSTDVSALHLDFDPVAGSSDDTFTGLLIDGITGTSAVENALTIGSGWDTAILANGKVGIGNVTPTAQLHVLGLTGTGAGDPGDDGIIVQAGQGFGGTNGTDGGLNRIASGDGGTGTSGNGGNGGILELKSGWGGFGISGDGGDGGAITILPGDGNGSINGGNGGTVTIGSGNGGAGSSTNGVAGDINIFPGIDGASSVNGTVRVRGDASSLFVIETNISRSMFVVDTSASNRVLIGSASADTVGTQLVLDTKNNAGDPGTAFDGGMYYNSNSGKFRCYEAGAWTDCITHYKVVLGSDVADSAGACTFTNITGLSFAVASGVTYRYRANIAFTAAATTTGLGLAATGPTASIMTYQYQNALTTNTLGGGGGTGNSGSTCSASSVSAASTANAAAVEGIITTTASGTLQLTFATEINGSAITIKAGSVLEWW